MRRELLRAGKSTGIRNLDAFVETFDYLPLTTVAMRQAAFWAEARNERRQTADDKALDGDVILAAQTMARGLPGTLIATTNVGHLRRLAPPLSAGHWIA
jgi:hypothetical protein